MSVDQKTKDEIDKKISLILSRYGGPHVYSKYKIIESICLFFARWKYRLTTSLHYKLKYFIQRHTRGYDDLDKWNAAWYIARKAIPVLKAMKENMVGTSLKWHREDRFGNIIELTHEEVFADDVTPPAFTEDEWKQIIDEIIFAFQFTLDQDIFTPESDFNEEEYKKAFKRQKRGLKLFSIYYNNLWD